MTESLWTVVPFLLPLLALSVYSVGLIVAKHRQLRAARALDGASFLSFLEAGPDRAALTSLVPAHPLAQVAGWRGLAPGLRQARAQALLGGLEDRLAYFPALANLATLTGLFGTVCGMIAAFLALRSGGGADPGSLASGLGLALVATALGLVTAIPCLAAHALFQKRVQALAAQLESLLSLQLAEPGGHG